MVEITAVSRESSEKDVEVKKRESSLSVESTRQLVQPEVDSSATELKVKNRVYDTVDTVFSGAKSPPPLCSLQSNTRRLTSEPHMLADDHMLIM